MSTFDEEKKSRLDRLLERLLNINLDNVTMDQIKKLEDLAGINDADDEGK